MLMLLLVSRATVKPAPVSVLTTSARLLMLPVPAIAKSPSVIALAASCLSFGRSLGVVKALRLAGSFGSANLWSKRTVSAHALTRLQSAPW